MRLMAEIKYQNSIARLSRGDAFDFVKSLPSESVDLMVSSPPYFMGKEYDRSNSLEDFKKAISRIHAEITRVIRPGGSVCWQVGNHVDQGRVTPLDAVLIAQLDSESDLILRNRIIWTFGHGAHATHRFSGRHESILWYTKGSKYFFELDAVRVPQKYPGKKHYKGPRKGDWSGNPLGKNPSDVWDIPNVKARHVEKTDHPCQFPTALARRLILALCPEKGLVIDPFMGSGTTGLAALMHDRNFAGVDIERRYVRIAKQRLTDLVGGNSQVREDKPVRTPKTDEAVCFIPGHFRFANGG